MNQRERRERVRISPREAAAERKQNSFTTLKIPEGMNLFQIKQECTIKVDILDYETGEYNERAKYKRGQLYYYLPYLRHGGLGADNKTLMICPRTARKPCPICDLRKELTKRGHSYKDKAVKSLKPQDRQMMLLYNLEDMEKGVQLFDCSYFSFGKLLDDRIDTSDPDDGYNDFSCHGEGGMSLRVAFKEEAFKTEDGGGGKFLKAISIDFKARRKPYPPGLIDELPCLDELLIIPEYDELKAMLDDDDAEEAGGDEDGGDGDEDWIDDAAPEDSHKEVKKERTNGKAPKETEKVSAAKKEEEGGWEDDDTPW